MRPGAPSHIRPLDGVRGLAILLVLGHHLTMTVQTRTGPAGALLGLAEYGWAGVPLFFVLSGFLITRILLASRDSETYFATFYLRRALRIFPLYYGVLVLGLLILPAALGVPRPSGTIWLWLYLVNIPFTFPRLGGPVDVPIDCAHFWSLAVEEQFYLVWPALVRAVRLETLQTISLLAIPVAMLSRVALVHLEPGNTSADFFTLSHVDALGIGALLAIRESRGPLTDMRGVARAALALAAVLMALALSWRIWHAGEQDHVFKRTAIALASGWLVWAVVAGGRLARLFDAALRSFGRYSYAIYVLHFLPGTLVATMGAKWLGAYVHPQGVADLLWIVGGCTSAYAAGWCSWHLFEARFARLKDTLAWAPQVRKAS